MQILSDYTDFLKEKKILEIPLILYICTFLNPHWHWLSMCCKFERMVHGLN